MQNLKSHRWGSSSTNFKNSALEERKSSLEEESRNLFYSVGFLIGICTTSNMVSVPERSVHTMRPVKAKPTNLSKMTVSTALVTGIWRLASWWCWGRQRGSSRRARANHGRFMPSHLGSLINIEIRQGSQLLFPLALVSPLKRTSRRRRWCWWPARWWVGAQ